jgi:hypothetical protein
VSRMIRCECGQELAVQAGQAGQRLRCPLCTQVVVVPEPPPEPDAVYAVTPTRKCPKCLRMWSADTVICVECGWNFHTGKRERTTYAVLDRYVDVGVPLLGTYTRIAVQRGRRGDRTLTQKSWLLFIPLGTSVLDLKNFEAVVTDYTRGGDRRRSDVFSLYLRDKEKGTRYIYSGGDDRTMKAIEDMLQEVAHLSVERR